MDPEKLANSLINCRQDLVRRSALFDFVFSNHGLKYTSISAKFIDDIASSIHLACPDDCDSFGFLQTNEKECLYRFAHKRTKDGSFGFKYIGIIVYDDPDDNFNEDGYVFSFSIKILERGTNEPDERISMDFMENIKQKITDKAKLVEKDLRVVVDLCEPGFITCLFEPLDAYSRTVIDTIRQDKK